MDYPKIPLRSTNAPRLEKINSYGISELNYYCCSNFNVHGLRQIIELKCKFWNLEYNPISDHKYQIRILR